MRSLSTWGEAASSSRSWTQLAASGAMNRAPDPGSTKTLEEQVGLRGRDPKYTLGVHCQPGERGTGRAAEGATTYLRGRVHLLAAMHRQGNLAALAAWGCALHHQTLRGESLEPGGKRTAVHSQQPIRFPRAPGPIPGDVLVPHTC